MFAPAPVEHAHDHSSLEFPHDIRAEFFLSPVVSLLRIFLQFLDQESRAHPMSATAGTGFKIRHAHRDGIHRGKFGHHGVEVPVLRIALGRVGPHMQLDYLVDEPAHLIGEILAVEHSPPLVVDHHALTVHHLVVLEDVLANLRVERFHLGLGAGNGPRDHLRLDRHIVGHVEPREKCVHHAAVEPQHQLVLQREVETRLPWISLSSRSSAQLVVDASGLVTFGTQHVEPAERHDLLMLGRHRFLGLFQRLRPRRLVGLGILHQRNPARGEFGGRPKLRVPTQHDVGATASHIGRHSDRTFAPSLSHDHGLLLMELGVEHLVRHPSLAQRSREHLTLLHAHRSHQHRLPGLKPLRDVLHHRSELGLLRAVNQVALVHPLIGHIGGDRHNPEIVGAVELSRLGLGGTGHAGQLVVQPEIVLQGDRGQGLVLGFDLHPLFGLDRLMQTLVVPTSGQDAAGVLIDDHYLALEHDVVLVPGEEFLRADSVVQESHQRGVLRLVEILDPQPVFGLLDTRFQHADGALLDIHLIVVLIDQPQGQSREIRVPLGFVVGWPGNDERRPGFVDEDRVHLIDDGVVVAALHQFGQRPGHVVAQVIETKLVIGAVGDVGGVGLAPGRRRHAGQDAAHAQPQEPVDATHPLGVTFGEVVVDRHDVHAIASQRIEVRRQGGDQRLALTGAHLGDVAPVQCRPAHDLHVVVTLPQGAHGSLADSCERLGQQSVERVLTRLQARAELDCLGAEFLVAQRGEVILQGIDDGSDLIELAQRLTFTGAQHLVEETHGHMVRATVGVTCGVVVRSVDGCPNSACEPHSRRGHRPCCPRRASRLTPTLIRSRAARSACDRRAG